MPLDIDTTQPFRSQARLVALVRAVLTAEQTDETVWLEWKSPIDLRASDGQFSVARQILGFANVRPTSPHPGLVVTHTWSSVPSPEAWRA
jgi:hypothetical protein